MMPPTSHCAAKLGLRIFLAATLATRFYPGPCACLLPGWPVCKLPFIMCVAGPFWLFWYQLQHSHFTHHLQLLSSQAGTSRVIKY